MKKSKIVKDNVNFTCIDEKELTGEIVQTKWMTEQRWFYVYVFLGAMVGNVIGSIIFKIIGFNRF